MITRIKMGYFTFLLIFISSLLSAQDIDSLRREVFMANMRIEEINESNRVDKLIINRAGAHFMTAGAAGLTSILFVVGGSLLWVANDKPLAWTIYCISGGFLTVACYQVYFGGKKMGWVGKDYTNN